MLGRTTRVGSRRRTGIARAGALLTVMAMTAAACSDDGDEGDDDSTGDEAAAEEGEAADDSAGEDGEDGAEPGGDVAHPTVTGPVSGGEHGDPWSAMPSQVADEYGYVEEEYFLEGEATSYEHVGEPGEDGLWEVTEAASAPYRVRILVRRPADSADASGAAFVEWLNVSSGAEADPQFLAAYPEILGNGDVYVGVSAQLVGIEGGDAPVEVPGDIRPLVEWDPERYGDLEHPGDTYSYDIYSQVAQALRRPDEVDVLDGSRPDHVIAMGQSQSAARMLTYVNAVHPEAAIYDGFLVHSRGSGGAFLDSDDGFVLGEGTAQVRDDLDVPVLQFATETDLFGPLGFYEGRQEDHDLLRTWEVAGTAHADQSMTEYAMEFADGEMTADGASDILSECGEVNDGPAGEVLRAALAGLRTWVVDGEAPAEAEPLQVEDGAIVRDEHGNALGGIRTPAVDAPVATLSGDAPEGVSVLCLLFGSTEPFDAATLADLYPTHQDYVDAVTESAEAAAADGFLLPEDVEALITEAEEAEIPG